jgi:hypothetical protein
MSNCYLLLKKELIANQMRLEIKKVDRAKFERIRDNHQISLLPALEAAIKILP